MPARATRCGCCRQHKRACSGRVDEAPVERRWDPGSASSARTSRELRLRARPHSGRWPVAHLKNVELRNVCFLGFGWLADDLIPTHVSRGALVRVGRAAGGGDAGDAADELPKVDRGERRGTGGVGAEATGKAPPGQVRLRRLLKAGTARSLPPSGGADSGATLPELWDDPPRLQRLVDYPYYPHSRRVSPLAPHAAVADSTALKIE